MTRVATGGGLLQTHEIPGAEGTGSKLGLAALRLALLNYCGGQQLQPLLPAEKHIRAYRRASHQRDRQGIAPLPIKLRHLLEVHAVDRGNEGRRHEDDREDREELDDLILKEVDAAKRRVQQELHFLRLEARVVFHRLQIAQRRL